MENFFPTKKKIINISIITFNYLCIFCKQTHMKCELYGQAKPLANTCTCAHIAPMYWQEYCVQYIAIWLSAGCLANIFWETLVSKEKSLLVSKKTCLNLKAAMENQAHSNACVHKLLFSLRSQSVLVVLRFCITLHNYVHFPNLDDVYFHFFFQ